MAPDPATLRAQCKCGEDLWRERGVWTLRAAVVRLVDGQFEGKCPKCGETVPIPFLALTEPPAVAPITPRLAARRRIARLTPAGEPA